MSPTIKTTINVVLLCWLTLAVTAERALCQGQADQYAAQGDKYFKAGDYSKAIEAYGKAVALDPSRGLTYYGLALCYHQQENWQAAVDNWEKARPLLLPEAAMLLIMANDYWHLKQYDNALKILRDGIALRPDPPVLAMFHYWTGVIDNELGQSAKAAAQLEKALRMKPNDPDFNFELGSAYYNLQRYSEAIAPLQLTIRSRPDDAAAYYELGIAYVRLRRQDEALDVYKQLVVIDRVRAAALHHQIMGGTSRHSGSSAKGQQPL